MPRKAREKSKTGIYAVLIKGKDTSRKLFYEDDDYDEFIRRLDENLDTSVIAFAICEDRICMVVMESERGIGADIKPVTVGYARYYGKRYETSGGIFERRFKSVPIETPDALARQIAGVHRFCDVSGKEGYTGRYIDDELFIPEEAMRFLGSRDIYDEAMSADDPITPFFSLSTGSGVERKKAPKRKRDPEKDLPRDPYKDLPGKPEAKAESRIKTETEVKRDPEKDLPRDSDKDLPTAKKKKEKMPSWLL